MKALFLSLALLAPTPEPPESLCGTYDTQTAVITLTEKEAFLYEGDVVWKGTWHLDESAGRLVSEGKTQQPAYSASTAVRYPMERTNTGWKVTAWTRLPR